MIVKLTLEDALAVARDMRAQDRHAVRALTGANSAEWFAANRWQSEGPAWALLEENGSAIFGLSMHAPWAATAWLVTSPGFDSWRKVVRHCRTVAANLKDTPLHRIEALVMDDWPAAQRFAARLGFKHEGTKRNAGFHGEHFQVWALTREPQ